MFHFFKIVFSIFTLFVFHQNHFSVFRFRTDPLCLPLRGLTTLPEWRFSGCRPNDPDLKDQIMLGLRDPMLVDPGSKVDAKVDCISKRLAG